jgi:hypothetical protein
VNQSLRSSFIALAVTLPLAAVAQQPPGGQAPASSTPEIAFMRADANSDGKLSKAEAARLPGVSSKFDALDKDKDGALSMSEYMAAFDAPKQ